MSDANLDTQKSPQRGDETAAADVPGADHTIVVELVDITKSFPGVVANDHISLAIHAGEIHALLGENGAGKSTLIAILSGVYQPDGGKVRMAGRDVSIESPRSAIALGIGTVFQHSTLVPTLSVLENLMLGGAWHDRLDVDGTRHRLSELSSVLGIEVDGDALAGHLALGQQQQIEIIKALWRGEKVLVLDEPTSMLTPKGVEELGRMMRRLRDNGTAILFITHKLNEAYEFGERISVLKLGRLVGEIEPAELAAMDQAAATERIVGFMFGREKGIESAPLTARYKDMDRLPFNAEEGGAPVLELSAAATHGVAGEPELHDISFEVRPGEIFGIAGVDGNGQKQLAEVLAGQRHCAAGDIRLDGRSILRRGIGERQALGLRYLTDERHGEGTVPGLSVAVNLVMKRVGEAPFWDRGLTRQEAIEAHADELIEDFDVRTPTARAHIEKLSGGNIQKALLARELTMKPRLVVYNKPTYGLDLANTHAARARIREQAAEGVAAIVISTELDELIELCDRIGVMLRGRLQGIVENGPEAETQIGELMLGARDR